MKALGVMGLGSVREKVKEGKGAEKVSKVSDDGTREG